MRRDFITCLGLGVAVGLMVLQPARAGDRRSANFHLAAAVSARGSGFAGAAPMKMQGHGEQTFSQVTPFESRAAGDKASSRQREEQRGSGPATSPRERRTITLLQFNPNVSVQPVIGGVNGAQLSVGF